MRYLVVGILLLALQANVLAQGCCSGGAGSPLAGGASTGVLKKNQIELSLSHQYNYTDEFYTGDSDTINLIDQLTSNYMFMRFDYGITDKFTMSLATGYYLNRTILELGYKDTISSSGISDIILLPRYSVFNKTRPNSRTEITLGVGLKIPIGSNTDSSTVGVNSVGEDVFVISPPTVQATTGSQDLMLYGFVFHGYQKRKLRLFANTLFLRKGYNSMGQKFGDYASLGLFVSKTVFKNIGLTAQVKGEWVGKMKVAETVSDVDLAIYNIDLHASGSKKVFFVPQVSYNYKQLTMFVSSEIPLYQYLTGVQPGSMYQLTTGLSYRFMAKKASLIPAKTVEVAPILN
jgi:hypothetical protein